MLTERQRDVLEFIQAEQREKGLTPSTREIQKHFGFASQTSVMQSPLRILQRLIGRIQFRESVFRTGPCRIGMLFKRFPVKNFFDRSWIEPGHSRLLEQAEIIRHAAKLSPQEQCATAFGFVTLNPPFWRSSL